MAETMAIVLPTPLGEEYGSIPVSRLSTSMLRDDDFGLGLSVALPVEHSTSNRHTLTCLETPSKEDDDEGGFAGFGVPSWSHSQSREGWQSSTNTNTTSATPKESAPYEGITVEIKNHSINNQGIVMYHVDIGGRDGILSMYTIRRRFRAFRNLYFEMDRLMTEYNAQLALMPQDDPSLAEAAMGVPCSPITLSYERQCKDWAMTPPVQLPPLPSAGIWTYLKRHDIHLVEHRKKCLQEVLRIVMQHPATRCSPVLDTFLSVAPNQISQRGTSYTSLQDYSVPVLDRKRESIERKQRKIRVLEQRQRSNSNSNPFSAGHYTRLASVPSSREHVR